MPNLSAGETLEALSQPGVEAHKRYDKWRVRRGRPAQAGEALGRVRLRPNRGFPRGTRLRRHPTFVRVEHDMRGHWHRQTENA